MWVGEEKEVGAAAFSSTVAYVIAFDAVSILLGALVWIFSEESKHQDLFMPILFSPQEIILWNLSTA